MSSFKLQAYLFENGNKKENHMISLPSLIYLSFHYDFGHIYEKNAINA